MENFQPTCTLSDWKLRQDLLRRVRSFFDEKKVLEVESPSLSNACGTDPHLDFIETNETPPRYLMTSPEFHMKRLLAAGFGDIYQIAKAFRFGEKGQRHNSEFTMVEWYRENMTMEDLMSEVEDLCSAILDYEVKAKRTKWVDAFKNYAHVDPFCQNLMSFVFVCENNGVTVPGNFRAFSREDWWDYIMVMVIELFLGKEGPEFLMAYPPSQAALAETYVGDDGLIWAKRFELYIDNMELCNGYQELTDAIEQEERFKQDLLLRERLGKTLPKIDNLFLEALRHGMPSCSGVALGLDRLFMLALKKTQIADVILFPDETA